MEKISLMKARALEALATLMENYMANLNISGGRKSYEDLLKEGDIIGDCIRDVVYALAFLPISGSESDVPNPGTVRFQEKYALYKECIRYVEDRLIAALITSKADTSSPPN
jgi:hypothetical protein